MKLFGLRALMPALVFLMETLPKYLSSNNFLLGEITAYAHSEAGRWALALIAR
jgi:hypothetical protein